MKKISEAGSDINYLKNGLKIHLKKQSINTAINPYEFV
tara:strand:- start:365 stop:478 length:114 start_codon:yes stop_codon:yes gene_type:complete